MGLFSNNNNDQLLKTRLSLELNGSTLARLKRLQRLQKDLEAISLLEKLKEDCSLDNVALIGATGQDIKINIVNNEIELIKKV